MHAVQPPEHRHRMEHDVLQIDRKVEQDHRGRNGQPGRYRKRIQQAPFALFGEQRETDGGERKRQTDQQGVKDNEGHVARPTAQAPDAEIPPRRQHFPRRHRGEHTREGDQAQQWFVGQEQVRHRRLPLRVIQLID